MEPKTIREQLQELGIEAVADREHFFSILGIPDHLDDHSFFTRGRTPKSEGRRRSAALLAKQERVQASRDAAHDEYERLLADGTIRLMTRRERLAWQASGHTENESVQAARRILNREHGGFVPCTRCRRLIPESEARESTEGLVGSDCCWE